jgi:glycosyltransferase involved in cell wall biosynthesis
MLPASSLITTYLGDSSNTQRLLERLALDWTGAPTEVVVVDNNPRPGWAGPTEAIFPFTVKIVHEPRSGLSIARNAALDAVTNDIVLCTDADTVPQPGWANRLVRTLAETGASCAGGRADLLMAPDASMREFDTSHFASEKWPADLCELVPPYWLIGCNLAFRASAGIRFREDLGVTGTRHRSCEDLEFVQQFVDRDLPVFVVPEALVQRPVHHRDVAFGGLLERKYWQGWSMAICKQLHPSMIIFDDYSWLSFIQGRLRSRRLLDSSLMTEAARLTGWSMCWMLSRLGLRPARSPGHDGSS